MRSRIAQGIVVLAVAGLVGACTSADLDVWKSHSTHFASGEHGFFSLRNNKDGSDPRVYRTDIDDSRQQSWWGIYAINVDPALIFKN